MTRKKYILSVCAYLLFLCFIPGKALAQWKELGPYGGGAHTIAMSDDLVIVGTRNAQLFKSSDQAATWQTISFPRTLSATLNSLWIDKCNPETWYVGLTDSGVYKTTDGGLTWASLPGLADESVNALT